MHEPNQLKYKHNSSVLHIYNAQSGVRFRANVTGRLDISNPYLFTRISEYVNSARNRQKTLPWNFGQGSSNVHADQIVRANHDHHLERAFVEQIHSVYELSLMRPAIPLRPTVVYTEFSYMPNFCVIASFILVIRYIISRYRLLPCRPHAMTFLVKISYIRFRGLAIIQADNLTDHSCLRIVSSELCALLFHLPTYWQSRDKLINNHAACDIEILRACRDLQVR